MLPIKFLPVFAILAALLGSATAAVAKPLDVVASFSIIGDFARQVGGDRVRLRVLVGSNGDAHVYEPKPADAIAMAKADVILVNGLQFEGFLKRLLEASGSTATVVELSGGIEALEDPAGGHFHHHDGKAVFHTAPFDPHAWQDVANASLYVEAIARAFCSADAEGCELYKTNAHAYLQVLSGLDREIRAMIAAIPPGKRVVVVAHNAFRYFEAAYGLAFLAPQGVSTEAEASATDVAGIIRQIRLKRASAVFAENIADSRLVEQIAREAGLPLGGTLYSDALSEPDGPAASYVEMMRHNARTLAGAITRR